jgi:hypothetical protein
MIRRNCNLLLIGLAATLCVSAHAAVPPPTTSVTLDWAPNADSNLVGYRLHYGTASGAYSSVVTVGSAVTTATVSNLPIGQTFYFALSATNNAGYESTYSTEVAYTVPAPNSVPVANAQSVTTPEDNAKAITLTGSDADNNPLTYAIVNPPAHGTLSGTPPSLTYSPALNFNGSDSFTFIVNDGITNSPTATVSITVTPVNDAPIANAQSVTTFQDTTTDITLTGSDVDGNPLTYKVATQPSKGTLTGSAPNLTYTPAPGANGADSFTFLVNDGVTNSATATVAINITVPGTYLTVAPLYSLNANGPWVATNSWPALSLTNPVGSRFYSFVQTNGTVQPVEGPSPNGPWTANALWPKLAQTSGFYRMSLTSAVR